MMNINLRLLAAVATACAPALIVFGSAVFPAALPEDPAAPVPKCHTCAVMQPDLGQTPDSWVTLEFSSSFGEPGDCVKNPTDGKCDQKRLSCELQGFIYVRQLDSRAGLTVSPLLSDGHVPGWEPNGTNKWKARIGSASSAITVPCGEEHDLGGLKVRFTPPGNGQSPTDFPMIFRCEKCKDAEG